MNWYFLTRHLQSTLFAFVVLIAGSGLSWSSEKDVTGFIMANTAVPQTVDREWRRNCPELFCGAPEKKRARVVKVQMKKHSEANIFVRGTIVANASFGALSPLSDQQTIVVSGVANPVACTFKLNDLRFADGVAQFLVDLFAGLQGKVYPFRDRRGRCDQYFPEGL